MDELTGTEPIFELDNFRGPLDLLLHLVREQEVDITEVDLSRLCDQYLAALNLLQELDINVAGEFLVMASTLVLIKSRSILPREEVDLEEELDPGDELILQLLEYRRYKTLSLVLNRRAEERAQLFPRGASEVPPAEEPELAEVSIWDLVGSYARLVEELGLKRGFDTLKQEKPLKAYLKDVLDNLLARESWGFRDLLLASGGPEAVFGVFLSILELVKSRQVTVEQADGGGEIQIRLRADRDESVLSGLFTDTAAPMTAEVEGEPDAEPPAEGAAQE
jgi:segregation and condensation protein A